MRPSRDVAVRLQTLRGEVYQGLVKRDPRVGDAFAADVPKANCPRPARRYFRRHLPYDAEPLWDGRSQRCFLAGSTTSAQARTVAKVAYYGAMAAKINPEQASAWNVATTADRTSAGAVSKELTGNG